MDSSTLVLVLILAIIAIMVMNANKGSSSAVPSAKGTGSSNTSTLKQSVEDIKATKTSRVVDQVAILDELEATSPNYRQYCELVGNAQKEGGVIAPYSRKQVAYYEIRCYRIENRGSGDVETLVAHEKSFDPFYFTDGSCETPVYVDIDSFGDHVMLVNSTNHIEGPNSEFARAVTDAGGTVPAGGSGVTAIVGELASVVVHSFGRARDAIRAGLTPQYGFALATAGGPSFSSADNAVWSHVSFAYGPGMGGGHRPQGGPHGGPHGGSHGSGHGSNRQQPSGLESFLGGFTGGYSGVPRPMPQQPYQRQTYRRSGSGDVIGDMITGMVLSTVLDSMFKSSNTASTNTSTPTSSFRGYRLVEDVVPLNSPIYCIGEIYHHGAEVHMGRSLSSTYTTSYFATRPETELLAALGA